MKQLLKILVFSVTVLSTVSLFAQVADQNPNFRESEDKYLRINDSLSETLGTTLQQTYKARDWYDEREERKALRRTRNHEARMNRTYYSDYNSPYYYNSWNSWRRYVPNIGFRSGDFWFSF
ncbi:hypothetical protein [Flavobacterium sp. NKUCC04_CG]|uniref:hypothetical protein n=1 Tax=Flavobacterium sp. NKUCC04_CG TaxID=2842121 RepID=UPI001C5B0BAA|nr:hypothetical protein [Flavobacterium sp. NKUCC04_CG]MBW3519011.1 hypothetical protein [Flavobacterium sp. NKUCC04_CG]